jgi:hypothetical protein
MTLIVRLPRRVQQELAEYCATRRLTRSEAVKLAPEKLLRAPEADAHAVRHPLIGGDKDDGSDVSGSIKAALRARLRRHIQTVEARDFSLLRLAKNKRFERVKWPER